MRVLLINEFDSCGGTEIQSKREIKMMSEKCFEYYYLTFDPNYVSNEQEKNHYNIPISFNNFKKIYHRIFTSKKYTRMISKIINEIKPEVIHINNLVNLPLDVYKSVMNYPTFQTIRDFGAVCPKSTCIFNDFSACKGYKNHNCKKCLKSLDLKVKYTILKKINKYRLNAVNKFICPSQALTDLCTLNGIKTNCVNNQFDFSIIKKEAATYDKKTFMYYGKISEDKGVTLLINAFNKIIKEYSDYKLIFIGAIDKKYETTFNQLILHNENITYLGLMKNAEIMDIYKDIYCVVVPSLWLENYPNTVLESIANKTLVIGSNRGGIPELIGYDDLLFDITKEEDLYSKIKYAIELDKDKYIEFTENRYNFIMNNNSSDAYCNKLIQLMNSLINDKAGE